MNTPLNSLSFDPCTDKRFYQYLVKIMSKTAENAVPAALAIATTSSRTLTAPEFQGLAEMPAEMEWFANIGNPRTRRTYRTDVADFIALVGIARPEEFSLHPTAATNALDHKADIAKVQEWLGHANIATTWLYERRRTRPEDSPTFKVAY